MYYFTLKNKFICLFVGAKYFIAFPIISILARYSLKFTRCSLLVVKSLVTRCKIRLLLVAKVHSLLVAKFARYSFQKLLVAKIRSLLVGEVAHCKNSLVTRCRIRLLLVAEVARCKNSFVVKNQSLLVAKFDRYLLHKFTKKRQLNLVMGDKI